MIGDAWGGKPKRERVSKILGGVKPDVPLSKKVDEAQKRLQIPISRLQAVDEKLKAKDDQLFRRTVEAQRIHNNAYATMYANELAQVRNIRKTVNSAKLSLEQIQLRLNTVSELGDIVVTLSPCMSVIKDLAPSIGSMIPDANASLQDLSGILGDLMSSSQVTADDAMDLSATVRNDASSSILEDAMASISDDVDTIIPKVPDSLEAPQAKTVMPDVADQYAEATNLRAPQAKTVLPEIPMDLYVSKKRSRVDELAV